jgi:hypothetical protein
MSIKRIWIAVSWIVVAGSLAFWVTQTSNDILRDQLRRWQFWALEVQFLAVAAASWIAVPRLWRALELRVRDCIAPALASLIALVLVLWAAPATNRIYYDEHIYQNVGQNLTDLHLAQMCNDGTVEYGTLQCWRTEYNKEPYGYPYILSLAYRLVGVRESVAFGVNAIAAALLVWVVFLLTTALTRHAAAGAWAAAIVALMPEQLRWSHTAAAEPTAALACAFAVLAAVGFVRERSMPAMWWMVLATVFAAQFRPECLLVAPLVVTIVLLYAPGELAEPRLWWAGAVGLLLAAVHVGHMVAVSHEAWGASGPRFSTSYFANNFRTNGGFFVGDARFPVIYTALALVGLLFSRERRAATVALHYFVAFWGIFLFFYAGSYNYGADDRFALMAIPAVAIMAGIGAWKLTQRIPSRVAIAAIAVQFLWYLPFVRAVGEEAWAAHADVAFARQVAAGLSPNSLVLTHNPSMFQLWGRNAAQASLAAGDANYVSSSLPRYAGGVYFHWNFWCNVADPAQQSFCTAILNKYPHTLVREYKERDYRYAIYRLEADPERKTGAK